MAALSRQKVIVVSGARSNVGKTSLTRKLSSLMPASVRVKIGHHPRKPGRDDDGSLYPMGTSLATIVADFHDAPFLIIESNSILQEITPDCLIYLPADNPKPSAEIARCKADIVRGETVTDEKVSLLARRMDCDKDVIAKIIELSGADIE